MWTLQGSLVLNTVSRPEELHVQGQMAGGGPPMEDMEGAADVMQQLMGQLQDLGTFMAVHISLPRLSPATRDSQIGAGTSVHSAAGPGMRCVPLKSTCIM